MTIELKIKTTATTPTQNRLYEMMTENTGKHFLDSGMSEGRHWQQNQKLSVSDFLARPKATLETKYGTHVTLDLFHFLNDRVELTNKAQALQSDWESFVTDDNALSFYDCETMETWSGFANEGTQKTDIANSYNWDNYLSQTIQYVTFENSGRYFVLLQIHNGADVRGGYTLPQVFEMIGEYAFYDMQDAIIQCTNADCEGFEVSIHGGSDVYINGTEPITSSDFYEIKNCRECGAELEALAPEAQSSW
jgi:hypothetical protein